MNCNVKAARVVFVARYLNVLQKPDKLRDPPAKLPGVGLDEYQLKNVDHQKATVLRGVLHDDSARD